MNTWRTLARKTVLEIGSWLRVESHNIQSPSGRVITDWAWIVTPNSVTILTETTDGKFVVLRESRYAYEGDPMGMVEDISKMVRRHCRLLNANCLKRQVIRLITG